MGRKQTWYDEIFFQSMFHLPPKDRMWGREVRKKDAARVLSLRDKEGLLCGGAVKSMKRNE